MKEVRGDVVAVILSPIIRFVLHGLTCTDFARIVGFCWIHFCASINIMRSFPLNACWLLLIVFQ